MPGKRLEGQAGSGAGPQASLPPPPPHPHAPPVGRGLRLISPVFPQLRSGERIKLIPLLCIVYTSVVWGFALFFFFQGLSTWQVSSPPATGSS